MKRLLVAVSRFRVSLKKHDFHVYVPELDFLQDLRNEIRALAPLIGSAASVSAVLWGISAVEQKSRKAESFDAYDFAEVNLYFDARGTVVLVDAVPAFQFLLEKYSLKCDNADENPSIYDAASQASNALSVLEHIFPGTSTI